MRLVVADTDPLNYLVLIGESEILPKLFRKIFTGASSRPVAPSRGAAVRARLGPEPAAVAGDDPPLRTLDEGERAALKLARALSVGLVLIDDRAGVAVARQQVLPVR